MANPRLPEFDENSPLRPSRFGHIVLRTRRFQEMSRWYRTVLNAEALFELPFGAFLTYDDEHHRVLIIQDPRVEPPAPDEPPPEPRSEGVAHWAYLFDSLTDLMRTYERLRDQGIKPTYCVNHGFQFSLYFHDPDHNEVELGCDNFATREETNEWFAKGYFAKNFYGYDFDPEDVYKWHHEGVSDAEIYDRTYKGDAPDLPSLEGDAQ
jgi:catechol 2,3-dioxygenase-like lactoylglutathione lyase family enzyme